MTHIVEVDEHLDYERYWTFPAHVHDITKAAGNRWWADFEGTADTYPCPPCKPGAQALAHGGHDVVSLLLGRRAQTPQHLERLFDMVDAAKKVYYGKVRTCSTCSTCGSAPPHHRTVGV